MKDTLTQNGTCFDLNADLYGVSIAELEERLELLRQGITKIEAELTKKPKRLVRCRPFICPEKLIAL